MTSAGSRVLRHAIKNSNDSSEYTECAEHTECTEFTECTHDEKTQEEVTPNAFGKGYVFKGRMLLLWWWNVVSWSGFKVQKDKLFQYPFPPPSVSENPRFRFHHGVKFKLQANCGSLGSRTLLFNFGLDLDLGFVAKRTTWSYWSNLKRESKG